VVDDRTGESSRNPKERGRNPRPFQEFYGERAVPPFPPTREPGPFKPHQRIFDQETAQAIEELHRPALGLFVSGLIAGAGVGVSVLLLGILMTFLGPEVHPLVKMALVGNAYAAGFIIVIMGRTDLFTEYSTVALFPVLMKQAPVRALARLWGIVYLANLLGGAVFALLLLGLGPPLGIIRSEVYGQIALGMAAYPWHVILGSAFLTGWLMGLLSWLVIAARESISQTFFIWLIAGVIGFAGLHHVITGAIQVFLGVLCSKEVFLRDLGHFLLWTTLGNIAGGLLFAVLVRYSILLHKKEKKDEGT
jgi:formate-nitrite transporter family protein